MLLLLLLLILREYLCFEGDVAPGVPEALVIKELHIHRVPLFDKECDVIFFALCVRIRIRGRVPRIKEHSCET